MANEALESELEWLIDAFNRRFEVFAIIILEESKKLKLQTIDEDDARKLLQSDNARLSIVEGCTLTKRMSVLLFEAVYTLIIYDTKRISSPDHGCVSIAEFRNVVMQAKNKADVKQLTFIVKTIGAPFGTNVKLISMTENDIASLSKELRCTN